VRPPATASGLHTLALRRRLRGSPNRNVVRPLPHLWWRRPRIPSVTARARRRPGVPDAPRTQYGPAPMRDGGLPVPSSRGHPWRSGPSRPGTGSASRHGKIDICWRPSYSGWDPRAHGRATSRRPALAEAPSAPSSTCNLLASPRVQSVPQIISGMAY
jgi:hypothetical protein